MNCDEAFEALTDPAGSRREDLRWHLGMCARCRELRETLAPALSSLDERPRPERAYGEGASGLPAAVRRRAISPFDFGARDTHDADARDASARGVFLSEEAVRVAEESAARFRRPGRRRWLSGCLKVAAGLLVGAGVAYAGLSASLHSSAGASAAAAPSTDPAQCLWLSSPRPADQSPGTVVLSCVACHLDAR